MDAPVLMRRPLPKVGHNGEHPGKSTYSKKDVKSGKAKVRWYSDELNPPDDKKKRKKVYYYIKLNGPSLFPFRPPKTLPKLKNGGEVKYKDNHNNHFVIGKTFDPSFDQIHDNCYFLDIDGTNLEIPVRDSIKESHEIPEIHMQNLNDNASIPEFVRFKPWRIRLLEQQYKQLCEYDNKKHNIPVEYYMARPSLEDTEYTIKRDCERRVVYKEIEDINGNTLQEGWFESSSTDFNATNDSDIDSNDFYTRNDVMSQDASELNLKGFFMDTLPIISSLLCTCVRSVDLSFNDFKIIPEQLFSLANLESLNMRNNPLSSIPKGIKKLEKLKHLDLSFCILTKLCNNICTLQDLRILDIRYNLITSIHENVYKLVSLEELFIGGNRITVFPSSILRLKLKSLHLKFNFTHKVFWRETCPPVPQTLCDLSMVALFKNNLLHKVPDHLKVNDSSHFQCAYCDGIIFGPGVTVLKPVAEVFGAKDLPLLFYVCSQTCRVELQHTEERPVSNSF